MTDAVWIALIAAIVVPLVTLVVNTVQAAVNIWMFKQQGRDIADIKHHTNSLTEQLVKVTRSDALREGAATERASERASERDKSKEAEQVEKRE